MNIPMRQMQIVLLLWNFLAIIAAITIFLRTGYDHFEENGFITILSIVQLLFMSYLAARIFKARVVGGNRIHWKDSSVLWVIISLGFMFLAADEYFMIHERIDFEIHRVFNIKETALTDRIDDALVGLYGLIGIGVLICYRIELRQCMSSFSFITFGFVLLFVTVALDALTNRMDVLQLYFDPDQAPALKIWIGHLEESLKIFAETFFILALYSVYLSVTQTTNDV